MVKNNKQPNPIGEIPKIFVEEEIQKVYEEMRKEAYKKNVVGKTIFL